MSEQVSALRADKQSDFETAGEKAKAMVQNNPITMDLVGDEQAGKMAESIKCAIS